MRIAVSASEGNIDAPMDPRFGRSPYFVIVDSDSMEFEAVENPGPQMGSGAGIQAAQTVGNAGAEVVVAGNFGPNAFGALSAAGIGVYQFAGGTVREAVQAVVSGQAQQVADPTVASKSGVSGGGAGGGVGSGGGGMGAGQGRGMGGGMGGGRGGGMGRGMGGGFQGQGPAPQGGYGMGQQAPWGMPPAYPGMGAGYPGMPYGPMGPMPPVPPEQMVEYQLQVLTMQRDMLSQQVEFLQQQLQWLDQQIEQLQEDM